MSGVNLMRTGNWFSSFGAGTLSIIENGIKRVLGKAEGFTMESVPPLPSPVEHGIQVRPSEDTVLSIPVQLASTHVSMFDPFYGVERPRSGVDEQEEQGNVLTEIKAGRKLRLTQKNV